MKCIIVDDEPLAIEILENYTARVDHLQLVATFRNAISAFTFLQQNKVDLIFLDIQMPKLTGIDFLKTLRYPPQVIFTTAYRDYALDGFDLEIVDYLLKPISFDRFLKAVGKASPRPEGKEVAAPVHAKDEFLYFKVDKKMVKCRVADILIIESSKDYVKVKTADKEIITQQKISYLEDNLPKDKFLRIHRSFIINLDKVDAFSAADVDLGTHQIPIGRNYKSEVIRILSRQAFQ